MTNFTFSKELEAIILEHIKKHYLPESVKNDRPFNDKDFKLFSKGAKLLSDSFTEERAEMPANYFNSPVLRSGYLLYFLPVNLMKIRHIMDQFQPHELLQGKIRVLDVGSGPGTSMLGLMDHYSDLLIKKKIKDAWLDFTLVDQNYTVLKDAFNLHKSFGSHLENKVKGFSSICSIKHFDVGRGGLHRLLRGYRYHLIIVSNLLNEFPNVRQKISFINELIENQLDPKYGKLILIEPALREPSRDLQAIRDEIVHRKKSAFVEAPCLHQEVCPLNAINKRDWCHFYFSWEKPKFIEKVDRLIGNKKDFLAASYLVLSKKERQFKKLFKSPESTWRIISNRMPTNGKEEMVLCGPGGRYHASRLNKDRAMINRDWENLRRGDIAELKVPTDKFDIDGKISIGKDVPIFKITLNK